jgi:dihydropteroate synthase
MRLQLRDLELPLDGSPAIVGIVNVTPDSFYDGGQTQRPPDAAARGRELVEAGAAMIDVGGMTAQPGPVIAVEDEVARVAPVIEALAGSGAAISVDTYRPAVAAAALAAGAHAINDHTGLSDLALAAEVAAHGAGLVITHLGLAPKEPQNGRYEIEPAAIGEFLLERAELAIGEGVDRDAIVLDPGLGFGKTTATDLATLQALPDLLALGYPLMLACSHKEVTAEPLGLPESSLEGTAAVVAIAAYLGVQLLRLHDLPFMTHVARMGALMAPPLADGLVQASGGDRSGANSRTNRPAE